MKIVVFGATGGVGKEVVRLALEKKHTVTAFVRNPHRILVADKNFSKVVGSIAQRKKVEEAIRGQDVVISTLGNNTSFSLFHPNTIISDGLQHILFAMKKHNVSRLIFVSSFGVQHTIFFPEKLFIRIFLKNIFSDIPFQERLIEQSNLFYTIVRPARLVSEKINGEIFTKEELPIGIFSRISRTTVAEFLVHQITNRKWIRKIVTISQ